MYIIKRTVEMGHGVAPAAALQAAIQIAAYVSNKQGLETKTAVNVGGSQHEIHWVVMSESLDILPAITADREADEAWQQLVAPFTEAGLFKPGSIRDEILQVIG
jgi:hypothetical protein